MMRIICLITGFIFGMIPTGFVVAKLYGKDIRKMGSGNIGTTNALRSLGKTAGALTLVGDLLKVLIPLFITAKLFGAQESTRYLVTLYTGLGAVLGHDFSPWMNFKGGKGIACSGGLILFTDPLFFGGMLLILAGIAGVSGYVSLGSLTGAVLYIALNIYLVASGRSFGWSGYPQLYDPRYGTEIIIIALIIGGLAIVRHKSNIQRLMNGNENRFFHRKEK